MATRTLTLTQWFKHVARHALDDQFENLAGYPVADTAKRLSVSPQRVYQLLSEEILDTLVLTNGSGRTVLTLVTQASVERYLEARVPDRGRQGYFAFPNT